MTLKVPTMTLVDLDLLDQRIGREKLRSRVPSLSVAPGAVSGAFGA